ncbi:aspartate aminotransferase family protein [Gordonia jinhuaensis]|uniref:Aspartate aminotransferase family protein n=2 Tax=Gordonia jinhuaensis TaxID=1517702 RepID=A0A916T1J5_9ACTN|nr:aspartate aminotransferase family protein [Gordonia jinhuaensis]
MVTSMSASATLDAAIASESDIFIRRQPRGSALGTAATDVLAGGATSSWQIADPQPVWLDHGAGGHIWDVDGNEYVDLHGGYGAGIAGHAHPAIVAAVTEQVSRGTHFAQPTEDALWVARSLAQRYDLPLWRFANSGTEATMDAVHLMRAVTGRDMIIKVEGCYHGHHDSVQVSVSPDLDEAGPAHRPESVPSSTGIPTAITELTRIVGFNDLDAVRRILDENPGQVAGMIVEPVMMNAGIITPEPGYLAGLRDTLHSAGALLTFDEVKTGFTAGPGGATARFGVRPDIICLAKSLGGGLSTAAIGGTSDVMSAIADGIYEQVGTFNGNPLAMAAARANVYQVLDDSAYRHLADLAAHASAAITDVIAAHGLAWHVKSVGAKGCVIFSPTPVTDYREFLQLDDRWGQLHWLIQHNGGVFLPPWGKVEQWLLSVAHTHADVDRLVTNFERLAVIAEEVLA